MTTNTLIIDYRYRRTHKDGTSVDVLQSGAQFFVQSISMPGGVAHSVIGPFSGSLDDAQAEADRRSSCAQPCECPGWEIVR